MIPNTAHFIWFGQEFPWVHLLSLRSAILTGGFERVLLHHADDLSAAPYYREALTIPGVEARRLEPQELLSRCGEQGPALVALYARLSQPAAKSNMVRLALLWLQGGVYLDLDTITVASLAPCMEAGGAFCGAEHLVFPAAVRRSKNPLRLLSAVTKMALRDGLRRLPGGFKAFKHVQRFYSVAANNAVMGAEAGHPFIQQMLSQALRLGAERQTARFALGTHLLQAQVAEYSGDDLRVYPPSFFYPLAPEISEHWFRETKSPELDCVLDGETRVVHWYASVRTRHIVPMINPNYVSNLRERQLFSALAAQFL